MAIIATAGDSKAFTPAPAGLHQAVCVDVVDMGWLEVTYSGKSKKQHKVRIVWQIDEAMEDGRRFIAQKRYTLSLHEKAGLRADLQSWRGRPFTDEELAGFDLEKLIGVNCFLNIMQIQKNGATYANVVGIVQLKKGLPKIEPAQYVRVKDRQPDDPPAEDDPVPELTDEDIAPF